MPAQAPSAPPPVALPPLVAELLAGTLLVVMGIICLYTLRHYWFTLSRLFGTQRHPYMDLDVADWPPVTVLVPAHNEEQVIGHILQALLDVDYPADRIRILPVNDRSTDGTREVIDRYAARYPERITPFHRVSGKPGKAAALRDATELVDTEILLVFDADYLPGIALVRQLVAPFFDPEVGAVMGRVVPHNVGANLLTRLLDLERSGGYQVDQQARMNLRLVPQYGGTVGGVRRSALDSIGGWRDDVLAEDTDVTIRLLLAGWQTVYQNRSECYEEVPEQWPVRERQIKRWARGHNQVMVRYGLRLALSTRVGLVQRLDGVLLLGVYLLPPVLLLGWVVSLALFYLGRLPFHGALVLLAVAAYGTFGNFGAFFEVAAAARLDRTRLRIRILPFLITGFLVSLVASCRAALPVQLLPHRRTLVWDKTARYRREPEP